MSTMLDSLLEALQPYEQALNGDGRLVAIRPDGTRQLWDTRRWLANLDRADRSVLERCAGPTLDVGCGPGRFVQAWALTGQVALGVDISSVAVELTARRGASVLQRDVFARVPGEGRWHTVLLMDGNIGIGGDPASLLRRLAGLIAGDGQLLIEVDADDVDEQLELQLVMNDETSQPGPRLRWALVGRRALARHAVPAGLCFDDAWTMDGREFVRLVAGGHQVGGGGVFSTVGVDRPSR